MLPDGRRIFKDKEKYAELVKLIKDGYSNSSIGRYFKCDRTSVIYHRQHLLINTIGIKEIKPKPEEELVKPIEDHRHPLLKEKTREWKTYAEYLADERKRNPPISLEEIIANKLSRQKLT